MEISAVSSVGAQPVTMSGASRLGGVGSENRMQGAVDNVAQLLGTSPQQLTALLNGGQSLAGVAASKGVSQTDLLAAIRQGVQQATPQGATGPSGTLLDRIAARIANHAGGGVGGAHHRHHGAHATAPATASSSAAQPPPAGGDAAAASVTTWL